MVVVWLSGCRSSVTEHVLVTQARCPGFDPRVTADLFTLLYFHLITSKNLFIPTRVLSNLYKATCIDRVPKWAWLQVAYDITGCGVSILMT